MGQIYFRISLFDVLSVGKIMYIFFKKQHGLVHLTKFHLERAASVNVRAPHLIISKDIARPLTMPLPVRRTEFRPQEFTPNFVLPVTHEMYIQPYLKYCLESNSYTFESNASRPQIFDNLISIRNVCNSATSLTVDTLRLLVYHTVNHFRSRSWRSLNLDF